MHPHVYLWKTLIWKDICTHYLQLNSVCFLKKIFFNVYLLLRDRETQSMSRGGTERRDTESEAGSRLWAVSTEPNAGLELTNCKIMTWAEVGRSTDWATQEPQCLFLRERERDRESVCVCAHARVHEQGRGRETETQTMKQAPGSDLSAQSLMWGSNSQTVRSWPELKSDA